MLPFLPPGGDQGRQEGSDATRTHPCSHYNAIGIRTSQNTKGEPITLETIQAAPTAHTRGTIHRRLQPLYTQTKKGFLLRLPPQKKPHAPAMRPLQCVLQQHVPIHAAITMRFASTCCRTPRANRFNDEKRSQPQPPHTQGIPFTAACSHFTRRNTRFCAPASSSKQTPCNSHAAITIRFVATRTHPCSHYNVICIHTLQNTKGEPILLETIQTAPAAHTRYLSSPPAATLHGKTHGFVLRLPPQHKPHSTFVLQPCDAKWDIKSHTTLHECFVLWCNMWC